MTTEEKFNAAVNVIRSLPKNGPYQPSNDLMLRFYAYYKQATLGPCTGSRPPFYSLVERAKYDAWNGLQNMTKTAAMAKYVDELHTIVETMSYSDKVANFLEAPTSDLDTIPLDDLELIAGDVLHRVKSQPNSPFASRGNSPTRMLSSGESSGLSSPSPAHFDDSDDEYIDTIDFSDSKIPNGVVNKDHQSRSKATKSSGVDISQDISKAVHSLKVDMEKLTNKISSIENSVKNSQAISRRTQGFFDGLSLPVVAFIVLWPFVASLIMNRYTKRRNN